MSTLGQKATLQGDRHTSALPQKSEITEVLVDHARRSAPSSTASPAAMAASMRCRCCSSLNGYIKVLRRVRDARLYIQRSRSDYMQFCGEEISSRWWYRSYTKAIGRRDI
jgi:hypothetical protein